MLRPYEGPARVIVGYDGSEDAEAALRYGVTEAVSRDAELVLVNAVDDMVLNSAWGVVFDPETIRSSAMDLLAAGVERATGLGLPVDRIRNAVELGNPAAVLSRHSEAASLIVLGRRSVAEGERAFVGSTAVGVVGTSHCPVIVVGADHQQRTERAGLIGVGVNTAAKGALALEWALEECEAHGGEVVVVSVAKAASGRLFRSGAIPPELQAELVEVTRTRIEEMIRPLAQAHPGVPVGLEVSYGSPVDLLVARTDDLDLIVVEVQTSFPTYSVGGVTRGLLTHARCPVGTILARDSHGS
ncbi:MAG: universal stress protein [Propionicimonas sp.]|nr:universal stress protein [Propionicimonas sp.]